MTAKISSLKFIIAPDSFKGSLSSVKVADAIEKGIRKALPKAGTIKQPIADGGELTTEILTTTLNGKIKRAVVMDPLGRKVKAKYGLIENLNTGIIEMSAASGMSLLKKSELNPLRTTTYGTGQLIKKLLDKGCRKIIIGLGGSATVDVGVGMLKALGVSLMDSRGKEVGFGGGSLSNISDIDISGLDARIKDAEILVLCDVDNKLAGPNGAARVFGPQKGASPRDVKILEKNIVHFIKRTKHVIGKDMSKVKYGGSAGGIAAALECYLGAELVNGPEYILELIKIGESFKKGGIVITGEGRLDSQTLSGKAPLAVASLAKRYGLTVICMVGQIEDNLNVDDFKFFDLILPIADKPMELEEAVSRTSDMLEFTSFQMARLIGLKS